MAHSPIDHRILSGNNSARRSLHAIFDGRLCRACAMLDRCPVRAPNHRNKGCQARDAVGDFRRRLLPASPADQMHSLQQTTEWKNRYKIRAGIEATNSESKRSHGIGRLRVRRWTKVCSAAACKLTACNIKRWARAYRALRRLLRDFTASIWVPIKLSGAIETSFFEGTTCCLRLWF